jgi:hypothetical protein
MGAVALVPVLRVVWVLARVHALVVELALALAVGLAPPAST